VVILVLHSMPDPCIGFRDRQSAAAADCGSTLHLIGIIQLKHCRCKVPPVIVESIQMPPRHVK
jgi:hypothetical protein